MKSFVRRATAITGIVVGLSFGSAGAVVAATDHVGGGVWSHGFSDGDVYSSYYHNSVCHGSTAVGTYTDRDEASAGYTSYASAPEAWANNQTYWNKTC
ncbi:lactococcin 972 family bacteriocin [Haloactinospora alba]|uniref:Lactococcin 972 family bacteriocin n=1 Tax=Haloactinospora alba TaxID=405555 RepID=A0A543N6X9_9ACTN|nr:lactococcin 972 family bacteriocin [Haloactinospora alba]TQN27560.1 lactococcin 972 family bacteriocin [Haloactinospora alba]